MTPPMASSHPDAGTPHPQPGAVAGAVPARRREPVDRGHKRPQPIGMERLRALRRAIREGRYPTDADVERGLERLFGRSERS
jgi:hypothetical protein